MLAIRARESFFERDYPTASTFVSHIGSSRVLSSVRKGSHN